MADRGSGSDRRRRPGERSRPPARRGRAEGESDEDSWTAFAIDVGTSIGAVLLVGLFVYVASGVWPPLVAVQSDSMQPHMQPGDLVFVMQEERFSGPGAVAETGVVTAAAGDRTGFESFGGSGDVIVFRPDGKRSETPVIHRAMFFVEADENWVDRADPDALTYSQCETDDDPTTDTGVRNCPAPYSGFITKGDFNDGYDQVNSISEIVRPSWVIGTAEVRLPGLGWLRLGVN